MCGIGGIIYKNENLFVQNQSLINLNRDMAYRGPDGSGTFIDKNIGLSHVRLAILDLSEVGHQPMLSNDDRYVIVFNGEIYNYIELRSKLSQKYSFKSKTDTEVLLYSFIEYGSECLNYFNGMFSFAIYDKVSRKIFAARDRFGIKPFFYFEDDSSFVFCSEITPILNLIGKKSENPQMIYDYLLFNRVSHTDQTFFKEIYKLQPGCYLEIEKGLKIIKRYFNLKDNSEQGIKSESEYLEVLTNSLKKTLRSDVPIGVCLSGGLDSSTLVSLISQESLIEDLHTFSAVYESGDKEDESLYIDLYKDKVKNLHRIFPNEKSLATDLEDFIKATVEPIPGTSEFAEYSVMKYAKKYCTVILNGQGPDEQLGGYDYFKGVYWLELFSKFKLLNLILEFFTSILQGRFIKDFVFFIYFLSPSFLKELITPSPKKFLNSNFLKKYRVSEEVNKRLYGSKTLDESLYNHFEYKFEHHLQWADRSGMWFSLEARFPYLDHVFCSKAIKTDINKKRNREYSKLIHRNSVRTIVPEQILNRKDKIGYDTPETRWFRSIEIQEKMEKLFNNPSKQLNHYLDLKTCHAEYNNFLSGNSTTSPREFWKWLNLDLWFKIHLN